MREQFKRVVLVVFLLFSVVTSASIVDSEVTSTVEVVEQKEFIKVSDISEYSVKTSTTLQDIVQETSKNKKLEEIHNTIPEYIASIEMMLNDETYKNLQTLNIRKLQQMQSELSVYLSSLTDWNEILKSRVEIYDVNRKLLEIESELWVQTKLNAESENAPEAIQEQILSIHQSIKELDDSTKLDYDVTLTDLNILTKNIVNIENVIEELQKNEVISSNKIFNQNALGIFEALSATALSPIEYFSKIYNAVVENFNESKNYFNTRLDQVYIFSGLSFVIALFVIYFNYLYMRRKLFVKKESSYKHEFYFIRMPLATIMILLALSIVIVFPDRPKSLMPFLLFLLIFPVFRIVQTMIQNGYKIYLYSFLSLYFLGLVHNNTTGYELEGRLFAVLLSIGLFGYMLTLLRKKVLDTFLTEFINKFASKILALFIVLSVVSIVANIYGAVLLSYRINSGIFLAIYSSLIFYTIYVILTGYVVVVFRRRVSTASHMLDKYSKKIENTTVTFIKVIMFLWWLQIVSKILSLYPYILTFKDEVLSLSWTVASTTISVSSIVDFVFIVFGTWAISKIVVTVLNVEVFARFNMPRGMPTAITTTLNYTIVISGTVVALSSLGVTPAQFTLVFGALGVGIGFGIRNIVANFVSGIIMVFERPVQLGDTIEINNTMGSVQSIGARSSTIKTFDGSEVIIPNADFIAKEITNWTLSDEFRRKIVVFKVDFDSDVEEVLSIMKDIAINHPDVLKEPEPLAVFQGFGENYIEFKLYFWLSQNLIVAQSEVSIGIYRALKKAGIKMPMPKQEMIVKNENENENEKDTL